MLLESFVCSEDLDLDCAIVNQVKVRSQAAAAAKPHHHNSTEATKSFSGHFSNLYLIN